MYVTGARASTTTSGSARAPHSTAAASRRSKTSSWRSSANCSRVVPATDVASPWKVVVMVPVRNAAATSRRSESALRPLSATSAGRLRTERKT